MPPIFDMTRKDKAEHSSTKFVLLEKKGTQGSWSSRVPFLMENYYLTD